MLGTRQMRREAVSWAWPAPSAAQGGCHLPAGLCLTCTSLPQSSPRRLNSNPVLLAALPGHTRLRWSSPHSHSPVLSRRFPQDPLQALRLEAWAAFPGTPNSGPVSRPALASALLPCCHWHCSSTSLPVCPQYCLLS